MNDEEISLSEMLEDPIFHQLLASDHISITEFKSFIALEIDCHRKAMAQRQVDLEKAHIEHLALPKPSEAAPPKIDLHSASSRPGLVVSSGSRLHARHILRSPMLPLDLRI